MSQIIWKTEEEFEKELSISFWAGAGLSFLMTPVFYLILALIPTINDWLVGVLLSFN